MNFGGYQPMWSKAFAAIKLIYAADHLYEICQKKLLKLLAWQVAVDKGPLDVGKNYKYLFQYLPAEKEKALASAV